MADLLGTEGLSVDSAASVAAGLLSPESPACLSLNSIGGQISFHLDSLGSLEEILHLISCLLEARCVRLILFVHRISGHVLHHGGPRFDLGDRIFHVLLIVCALKVIQGRSNVYDGLSYLTVSVKQCNIIIYA